MIPCKFCNPNNDLSGNPRGGLKQKGRTQRAGTMFRRTYVCRDCETVWRMLGDMSTRAAHEVPVLVLIKDGRS